MLDRSKIMYKNYKKISELMQRKEKNTLVSKLVSIINVMRNISFCPLEHSILPIT